MRALLQERQARVGAREKIYAPTAELLIRTSTIARRGPDVSMVSWQLEKIVTSHPWHDVQIFMRPEPQGEMEVFDNIGKSRTIERTGSCHFSLVAAGCFRSDPDMLKLRRGQILAFENWLRQVAHDLAFAGIPNLGGVQPNVVYKVLFPEIAQPL